MNLNICRVCGYVSENSDFFATGGEIGVCKICADNMLDEIIDNDDPEQMNIFINVIQDDIQEPAAVDDFVLQEDDNPWSNLCKSCVLRNELDETWCKLCVCGSEYIRDTKIKI